MREFSKYAKEKSVWCGLNCPENKEEDADVVIFGIPYDKGVSYRSGAKDAPAMLRENTITSTPSTERLAFYGDLIVMDGGDFIGERDEFFQEVEDYVSHLVSKEIKFTMIGGDHSVTIPVEKGINKALNEEFGIIHIDAHMDLCDSMGGDLLSHGSVQKRALEMENTPSFKNLFFIGIRSIEEDEFELVRGSGLQVKTAYDCYIEGMENVATECIRKMEKFDKVYLTFDIDALDPAYAAGTGTPQFGGITSRMALTLLEKLFTNLNIIGFDIVEIAPKLDDSLTSMYAGRKIVQECWGYWADKIGKLEKL